MSGQYVICIYRPKIGQEAELRGKLQKHLDVLDHAGLLASRQHLVMQSEKDGAILELLEWKSPDAARLAHEDRSVQAIWGELADAAEMLSLKDLAEAESTFPHFRPLAIEGADR